MSFDEFIQSLQHLKESLPIDDVLSDEEKEAIIALQNLNELDVTGLADLIHGSPVLIPILASCVGLSKERLKSCLTRQFKTSGWYSLAKQRSVELIEYLDHEYDLINRVNDQRKKAWSFTDVLAERRLWSQRIASRSVVAGRGVEDVVENVIIEFNVPYVMRTSFEARGYKAPCDFAIPNGGQDALIVGAAKGFDSTGSKLTDTVREIEKMANVRKPSQFVFAIVDGDGWLRRQSDLRRIYNLYESQAIDGLYSLSKISSFRSHLKSALQRHGYSV